MLSVSRVLILVTNLIGFFEDMAIFGHKPNRVSGRYGRKWGKT